jgi:hypothetical protein
LYRAIAIELGVRPSHRRSQVWADLKKALLHLVDERGTHPIVVIDEAPPCSRAWRPNSASSRSIATPSSLRSNMPSPPQAIVHLPWQAGGRPSPAALDYLRALYAAGEAYLAR